MDINNITSNSWSNLIKQLNSNKESILVEEEDCLKIITRNELDTPAEISGHIYKPVSDHTIIHITLRLLEENTVTEEQRHILSDGIRLLGQRKIIPLEESDRFSRTAFNQLIEEGEKLASFAEAMKADREISLQFLHSHTNFLPEHLAPEQIEWHLFQLKEDSEILSSSLLQTTYLSLVEKTAQLYVQKGDITAASQARALAAHIPPSPRIANLIGQLNTLTPEEQRAGLHIQDLDTGILKNGSLCMTRRESAQGSILAATFKVTHPARREIEHTLQALWQAPHSLANAFAQFHEGIEIKMVSDGYSYQENGETCFFNCGYANEIVFRGIGRVIIGAAPPSELQQVLSQYNRVQVILDPHIAENEAAKTMQTLLAALGMAPLLSEQRDEDREKMRLLQLIRHFDPPMEYRLSHDPKFFNLPLELLKAAILIEAPWLTEKIHYYFDSHPELMYRQEIYPGKSVWAIHGAADRLRERGVVGLYQHVGTNSILQNCKTIAKILKYGALSTQDRLERGWVTSGASPVEDLSSGGGDCVFTRLATHSQLAQWCHTSSYYGDISICYKPEILERGGYGYLQDTFGTKSAASYKRRRGAEELVNILALNPSADLRLERSMNEFMVKNRIPREYISSIVVNNNIEKNTLIKVLREEGLIETVDGQELIFSIPIDQFIYVSTTLHEKHWNLEPPLPGNGPIFPENLDNLTIIHSYKTKKVAGTHRELFVINSYENEGEIDQLLTVHNAYRLLGGHVPEAKKYQQISTHDLMPKENFSKLANFYLEIKPMFENIIKMLTHRIPIALPIANAEPDLEVSYGDRSLPKVKNSPLPTRLLLQNIFGNTLEQLIKQNTNLPVRELRSFFVLDCLLANSCMSNPEGVIISNAGTIWRIDNSKNLQFTTAEVSELEHYRNPISHPQAAKIYGNISNHEIILQINEIAEHYDELAALPWPEAKKDLICKRMDYLINYRNTLVQAEAARKAELESQINDPEAEITFIKAFDCSQITLHGIPLREGNPPAADELAPPFIEPPIPPQIHQAAVLILEADNRVWVSEVKSTQIPERSTKKGETLAQAAIAKAKEQLNLEIQLEETLFDKEGTRYYLARRIGGNPSQAESGLAKLIPLNNLTRHTPPDQQITISEILKHARSRKIAQENLELSPPIPKNNIHAA